MKQIIHEHKCKYCEAMTTQDDEQCYANPNNKMNEEIKKEARELVDHHRTYVRMADKFSYLLSKDEIYLAKQHALKSVQNTIDALSEYDKRTEEYLRKQFPNYFSSELQNMESDFRYYFKLKEAVESL